MRRLLVMALLAMSVAIVSPTLTVSPASAAETPCNVNEPWPAPWWWGNSYAFDVAGTHKVLAVSPPFGSGSGAYLWGLNGSNNQKWVHDCVGYDHVYGRNLWRLRNAANTNLCLDTGGIGYVALTPCGQAGSSQRWERVPVGGETALVNAGTYQCLNTHNDGYSDGTLVVVDKCNYGSRQLWY